MALEFPVGRAPKADVVQNPGLIGPIGVGNLRRVFAPQRKAVDGVEYENWTVCESVRTERSQRQRNVANLGKQTPCYPKTQIQ